jgi:hypothetical protein
MALNISSITMLLMSLQFPKHNLYNLQCAKVDWFLVIEEFMVLLDQSFQPQHYWNLQPNNSLFWHSALFVVDTWKHLGPLDLTWHYHTSIPIITTKLSRHSQMSPMGQNFIWLRTCVLHQYTWKEVKVSTVTEEERIVSAGKLTWTTDLFFFLILFICAYNVWVISLPFPLLPPLPPPYPRQPGRNYSALISNCVEERV